MKPNEKTYTVDEYTHRINKEIEVRPIITLQEKAKIDNEIMKLLKISSIDHVIARTSLGDLTLRLHWEGTSEEYHFVLDSVVQDKETSKKLLKLFNGILYTL